MAKQPSEPTPPLPAREPCWDDPYRTCPVCGGQSVSKISSKRAYQEKLRACSHEYQPEDAEELNQPFILTVPRACGQCGAIWMVPLGRLAGIVLLIAGVLAIAAGVWIWSEMEITPRQRNVIFAVLGLGIAGASYGVALLAGKKGKGTLVDPGRK